MSLALPQVKTRSGGYLGLDFALDSLKSMNRDMEKGIVLRERSCRTAAETFACRTCQLRLQCSAAPGVQPAGAAGKLRPQFSSRSTPPKLPDCRRSFGSGRTASTAARLPPYPRRQSGSSAPGVQSLSRPCLLLWIAAEASAAVRQKVTGIVIPELRLYSRGNRRVSPAGAARPLVHKILAMLRLERSGEVGGNILCPLPT